MRRCEWWLSVLMLLFTENAGAAVGTWQNYTSMKEVRDVARTGDTFWAATSGGLFSWNQNSSTFDLFTNANGLRNVDLTAVGVDRNGNIWTGTSTGIIHIYSPSSHSWQYVFDLAQADDQTDKRINRFVMYGDTVLICTNFGLSVFFIGDFQFGDTYKKFGALPTNARVAVHSAAIFHGALWAAISTGASANYIAVANLSDPNILPPESWTLQSVSNTTVRTNTLSVFNGSLYAGTNAGLFSSSDTSWSPIIALAGRNIAGAVNAVTSLALCTSSSETYTLDNQGTVLQYGSALPYRPTSITFNSSSEPIVGTENGILTFASTWQSFVPNGPNSNQFLSVVVDDDGVLWAASGYNSNGKGFYRLKGSEWKSFTVENAGLPTNDYFRVSVGCDGSLWASSWGRGVVEIPRGWDTVDASHVFGKNVGMAGLPNDTNFIVVSSVQCDARGNHWMNIIRAVNRNIVVVRRADGTWLHLPLKLGSNRLNTLLENPPVERSVAVDASGNIWFASQDPTFKGLVSLGNQGMVDDSVAYYLTDANGLPSNDVKTVVVDRDNDLWVGTDHGIAIILDPDHPTRSGSIAAYRPPFTGLVNTIAIDPLNQKWVGTNEGAFLFSQDGTQQLASYTVESTGGKLIDNDIKSIAIDSKRGIVYFGTSSGLASLTTPGISPRVSFDELLISPNPYVVPNAVPVTIDGLVENSTLKILSIDGRLVRTISTPGGRIGFWDGKDDNGNESSTGVYVVVAYSEDGSKVATGKVALVRR